MTNEIVYDYIYSQVMLFVASARCCIKFCGSLRLSECLYIEQNVLSLRLKVRFYICNGIKTIALFKNNCSHFIESISLIHLQPQSRKDLFLFSKHSCLGGVQELEMSPDFCGKIIKPIVQQHRFSLGLLKQSMAQCFTHRPRDFQNSFLLAPFKEHILEVIKKNRVAVIDSDSIMEMSVSIPTFLVEQSAQEHSHCKIICVEREELLAIYNCERLSSGTGEKIGGTVGYQVHLQSRISENSNLIYTTASYLLRVLMGQTTLASFHNVSHILINDINLHDALNDILLCELKQGLKFHHKLKLVLFSNSACNDEFLSYFGECEEFRINSGPKSVDIIHLDEIKEIIAKHRNNYTQSYASTEAATVLRDLRGNAAHVDKSLEDYNFSGSNHAFDKFLYLVNNGVASADYQHSLYRYTAVNIAQKYGYTHHVEYLLQMKNDPQNRNQYLPDEHIGFSNTFTTSENNSIIDYVLIDDIIQMILTKSDWKAGNILVLLPNYDHILRLNYYILRSKLVGNLPKKINIYLLHCDIGKDQLYSLTTSGGLYIVLATDIVQTMGFLKNFSYVIDSACVQRSEYDVETKCEKIVYGWISREDSDMRVKLAGRTQGGQGICFRLITNKLHKELSDVRRPQLLTMQLDRMCLTVKILSRYKSVAEYFQNTIVKPPFLHIYDAVERLKKLEVLDSFEDLTWLGCRLIDIPVECNLGKLLIFGILLQCFDPILTIVSFLKSSDPLEFPKNGFESFKSFAPIIRYKVKKERNRLAKGSLSDHLIFIRLYQEWQNQPRDCSPEASVVDEHNFFLNGILERISGIRTLLVGALRSSQLIHSQGDLSMHYINLKSNSWPVIKAALVGGLYPQICVRDSYKWEIKSPESRKIMVHPSSVICGLEKFTNTAPNYSSAWIVYSKEICSINCNKILCCTVVSPVAIAMFAAMLEPVYNSETLRAS